MKRLAKAGIAATFALGTFATVNTTDLATHAEAEEMTDDVKENAYYYKYEGHTGYQNDPSFLLDKTFLKGLADNNFTLNGYEVDADPDAYFDSGYHEIVEVYDQTLHVNEHGVATQAELPVNEGTISTEDLEEVYGEPEDSSYLDNEGNGMYFYFEDDSQISFSISDGEVNLAKIGAHDSKGAGDQQIHNLSKK